MAPIKETPTVKTAYAHLNLGYDVESIMFL